MQMDAAISPLDLNRALQAFPPPALIDVRRQAAFDDDPNVIQGAIRGLPDALDHWAGALEPWRPAAVYCAHGHDVGRDAATALRHRGLTVQFVDGGLDGWRAAGLPTAPWQAPTRWVTRERPKIDRIACPWLIRRFIDPAAEFFYVPSADVRAFAASQRCDRIRHPRRHLWARRPRVQLRRVHPAPRARPPCAREARGHRPRCRHGGARPCAAKLPGCSPRRAAFPRCSPTTTRC